MQSISLEYSIINRIDREFAYKRENNFTQQELANIFKISRKKFVDFENGKILDFWLLTQYAAILGDVILFEIKSELN